MSIASMTLGDAPDQVLQQALYGSVPEIKPYDALGELNKRVKSKQVSSAMQGNDAIQKAKQMAQQPPVAQQLLAQLNQGVGGLPVPETQSYASGGVVAFAEGGMPYSEPQEEKDRQAIIAELKGMGDTVGKLAAAGYDITTLPIRALAGIYNTVARGPRAFGVPLPFVPKEFGTESMTPMYDKYFRTPDEPVSSGRGQSPGRTADMPAYVPPPEQPTPPVGIAAPGGSGRPATGSAPVSRTGIATLTPPTYKPVNPEYEVPEEVSAEELRKADMESTVPAMSEYDERMGKFSQRAKDMQEGKGIKKPTRFQRGMGAFMSGASEEYAAARRAGVRPSLGAALAAAGGAASKADADLQAKIEAMREKGFEAEQALEQSRMAYKAGQQELGAKYRTEANKAKMEALSIRNKMKDNERSNADKIADRELELYKIAMREQSEEKNREATIKAAGIRASNSSTLTPQRMAELRRRVEVDVDKQLEKDPKYLMMQVRTPAEASAYREQLLSSRLQRVLMEETGAILPTAPGATPGVAPSRVIDFSTIK